MFQINEKTKQMLDRGYEELLAYCSLCVLTVLKKYDDCLFLAELEANQIFYAKMGTQLIDACSKYNAEKTIIEECVQPEKIDCYVLMDHYAKKGAIADFRVRWETMLREMYDDFNKRETRNHFDLPGTSNPDFIQLFLNYRLGRALYTFGDRHPDLFYNQTERNRDTWIFNLKQAAN